MEKPVLTDTLGAWGTSKVLQVISLVGGLQQGKVVLSLVEKNLTSSEE